MFLFPLNVLFWHRNRKQKQSDCLPGMYSPAEASSGWLLNAQQTREYGPSTYWDWLYMHCRNGQCRHSRADTHCGCRAQAHQLQGDRQAESLCELCGDMGWEQKVPHISAILSHCNCPPPSYTSFSLLTLVLIECLKSEMRNTGKGVRIQKDFSNMSGRNSWSSSSNHLNRSRFTDVLSSPASFWFAHAPKERKTKHKGSLM